jgi:hypothetical protein
MGSMYVDVGREEGEGGRGGKEVIDHAVDWWRINPM